MNVAQMLTGYAFGTINPVIRRPEVNPQKCSDEQRAMLDGMALELRLAHALPSKPDVIPEPEVAREYTRIKRVVAELYDISGEKP